MSSRVSLRTVSQQCVFPVAGTCLMTRSSQSAAPHSTRALLRNSLRSHAPPCSALCRGTHTAEHVSVAYPSRSLVDGCHLKSLICPHRYSKEAVKGTATQLWGAENWRALYPKLRTSVLESVRAAAEGMHPVSLQSDGSGPSGAADGAVIAATHFGYSSSQLLRV